MSKYTLGDRSGKKIEVGQGLCSHPLYKEVSEHFLQVVWIRLCVPHKSLLHTILVFVSITL